MVAIAFRVTCITKRPKIQCLEHNKCSFSCDNLNQEFRAGERSRGLAPCSFSGTQANCLSVIFRNELPGYSGGFHLHSSSQKERMNIDECPCWGSLLTRPASHTYRLSRPSVEKLVTWPYLTARGASKCVVAGHVASSLLWRKRILEWIWVHR